MKFFNLQFTEEFTEEMPENSSNEIELSESTSKNVSCFYSVVLRNMK